MTPYYASNRTRLFVGDCLDVMRSARADCVDAIVTSPPYDAIRDYGNTPPIDLIAVGTESLRVLKNGGVAVVVLQDQTKDFAKSLTTFRTAVAWCDAGFRLWECCIYHRAGTPGAWWNSRFRVDHEYVLVFLKGKRPTHFDKSHMAQPAEYAGKPITGNKRQTDGSVVSVKPGRTHADTKCGGTVRHYASSGSHEARDGHMIGKRSHPATFPEKLASDFIRAFCPPGGTVLDPFAGSGTTLVQAVLAGRLARGVEIHEPYAAIAAERIRIAEKETTQ